MGENKIKIIAELTNDSYAKLMTLLSLIDKENNGLGEFEKKLRLDILNLSGQISYKLLYKIHTEFPELKEETVFLEKNIMPLQEKQITKIYEINNISTARIFVYLSLSAFNNLGERLVRTVLGGQDTSGELYQNLKYDAIKISKDIIEYIVSPLLMKFPVLKEEIDEMHNQFGIYPC